ncbi:GAF domain-containing protein [Streptomyces sp. SPB162]|uniref:GAF domain-containing protein n=1 Tax=Streptomyces sp. SPB162 TaxID=2940560 RepID=UPI0024066F92|nr:GAF domain-containing protein [Streptomyces sp. SPB162]MDF9816998.1 GAF domain-containing protein [Streptomyces sp. SPB162]
MSYDPAERHLLIPEDTEAVQRDERLRAMGLTDRPDAQLDEFAARLAATTGASYAMVNLFMDGRQYFAGLHTPSGPQTAPVPEAAAEPGREMTYDQGFCPHVVNRRKSLVLEDVCDYPRFAGNRVVDELGIRTYLGAPLIDHTGTTLGTICVVDIEPRPWGQSGLETIKALAAEAVELLKQREAGLA